MALKESEQPVPVTERVASICPVAPPLRTTEMLTFAGVIEVDFAPVYFVVLSEIAPSWPAGGGVVALQVTVTSPVRGSTLMAVKLVHVVWPAGRFIWRLPTAI